MNDIAECLLREGSWGICVMEVIIVAVICRVMLGGKQ